VAVAMAVVVAVSEVAGVVAAALGPPAPRRNLPIKGVVEVSDMAVTMAGVAASLSSFLCLACRYTPQKRGTARVAENAEASCSWL